MKRRKTVRQVPFRTEVGEWNETGKELRVSRQKEKEISILDDPKRAAEEILFRVKCELIWEMLDRSSSKLIQKLRKLGKLFVSSFLALI